MRAEIPSVGALTPILYWGVQITNADDTRPGGLFAGTRWPAILREVAGMLHREMKITFTPLKAPEKWVFVVGCYNSGTELLMHLLGDHPSIASLPQEGHFLTDQFTTDFALGLPRMWVMREDLFRLNENDEGPDATRLKKEWLMRIDRSRPILLEKSPPNAARTRWLQKHFENSHFICIVRNGYAVAEGIRRKAEPAHLKEGWPLESCAIQWARSNEILLEDSAHLRNCTWVRYEDLTADPAGELDRLLKFLGARGSLNLDKSWQVHEKEEPIRDMNPQSIAHLDHAERAMITRVCGPMLQHFGYELLE